jgi:hypothetical protein
MDSGLGAGLNGKEKVGANSEKGDNSARGNSSSGSVPNGESDKSLGFRGWDIESEARHKSDKQIAPPLVLQLPLD